MISRERDVEADIIGFKEIHTKAKEERYIGSMFKDSIFHVPAQTNQKGGMICILPHLQLVIKKVTKDKQGILFYQE